MPHDPHITMSLYPFDARGISKRFRHASRFGAPLALAPGEGMRFFKDHDPIRCCDSSNNATASKCA